MNKIFLIAVFTLLHGMLIAQTDTNNLSDYTTTLSYQEATDNFLKNISANSVPSGVLYDRINPIGAANYLFANDTITTERAIQLWHEMYNASYITDLPAYNLEQLIKATAICKVKDNSIPIGFINYNYNIVDSATWKNKFSVDANNVANFNSIPVFTNHNLLLPILFTHGLSKDKINVFFDTTFTIQNNFEKIQQIILIMPDKSEIIFLPNERKQIDFSNIVGDVNKIYLTLKIKTNLREIEYVNSYSFSNIKKTRAATSTANISCSPVIQFQSGSNLTFQGYNETIPTQAFGEYKIYYKLNSLDDNTLIGKKLSKPVILLDGFDFLNAERKFPDDIYNLFGYDNGNQHLGNDLRLLGYDIVVLNFPIHQFTSTNTSPFPSTMGLNFSAWLNTWRDGGTDFMERNGLLLERLLIVIDSTMKANNSTTTEKITVIGPSMGGQISRYAIKDMEDKGQTHNVGLWCAFDSPNHGANIPMGLQGMSWFGGKKLGDAAADSSYIFKIRSVAAKQLLIHQLGNLNANNDPIMVEPFRSTWQSMIDAKGMPQQCRKVALINGAADLSGTNLPGITMFKYDVTKSSWPWAGHLFVSLRPKFLYSDGTTKSVFYGYKYGIFGSTTSNLEYSNNTAFDNIDAVQGSPLSTGLQTYNSLQVGILPKPLQYIPIGWCFMGMCGTISVYGEGNKYDFKGTGKNTFIPSWSSLAIKQRNYSWYNPLTEDLTCTARTPFDDYMTASTNEDHVFISNTAASWAIAQIIQGDKKCPQVCGNSLNGDNRMCIGDASIFSLANTVPPNVDISWTKSTSLNITGTGSSVTVTCTGTNANAWVTVGLRPKIGTSFCRDWVYYTYQVAAGNVTVTNQNINFGQVGINACNYAAYISNLKPYNSLQWSTDGINFVAGNDGFEHPNMFLPAIGVNMPVWVKIYDGCNFVLKQKYFTKQTLPIGCSIMWKKENTVSNLESELFKIDIFPNPTNTNWECIVYNYLNKYVELTLTDITGKLIWKKNYNNLDIGNIDIDASNLITGTYLLKVKIGAKTEIKKLIKQ